MKSEETNAALDAITLASSASLVSLAKNYIHMSSVQMMAEAESIFDAAITASQDLARKDMESSIGLNLPPAESLVRERYFLTVKLDTVKNVSALYVEGYDTPEKLDKFEARLRNRLIAGLTAVVTRAYSEEQLKHFDDLGKKLGVKFKKRWVSRLTDRTCARCKAMHGKTVDLDTVFKEKTKEPIFYDLQVPGLHPRCECHIEIAIV